MKEMDCRTAWLGVLTVPQRYTVHERGLYFKATFFVGVKKRSFGPLELPNRISKKKNHNADSRGL